MQIIKNFIKSIDLYISCVCIALVVTVTLFSIVMRYIFENPIQWIEEINLALMVCFTFLGSAFAFKDDEHISIDLITKKLYPTLNRLFFMIRQIIILLVVGYVFVYLGLQLAMQATDKVTTVLNIPYTLIDLTVVIGGIIAIFRIIKNTIKDKERIGENI